MFVTRLYGFISGVLRKMAGSFENIFFSLLCSGRWLYEDVS